MTEKLILQPDASHPITVEREGEHVVVSVDGRTVADTHAALTLREADYPPVRYIPLADVDSSLLEATDHSSYCPYKGDCSYYSLTVGDGELENVVWEYRDPYAPVSDIRGHVAFYPNRVQITSA
ncbi:MAG TPA: DUF427 domain-containing protein [Solirubrobacteraceae bacterium]|jgi:uncharacterized protein (DUF427 family)